MNVMFKYVVPVDGSTHVIELKGPIRHVAALVDSRVTFWAENHGEEGKFVKLTVVGTGHTWPEDFAWAGTAVSPSGLVWHLLYRPA